MGRPFNVLTNVAGSLRRFLGAEGPLSFRDDIKNPVRARGGMTQTTSSAVGGPFPASGGPFHPRDAQASSDKNCCWSKTPSCRKARCQDWPTTTFSTVLQMTEIQSCVLTTPPRTSDLRRRQLSCKVCLKILKRWVSHGCRKDVILAGT